MTNSDQATAGDDDRVHEWEAGLPSSADLTPLYQALVPKELAFALSVSPEPHRTLLDVNRASKDTFSEINSRDRDPDGSGSDSRKLRKVDCAEEADSALMTENSTGDPSVKRPRLVWTPQLHKRFVDVAAHLGIEKAVPKTIMGLMNVEGLTRENVASHLQKYRLYLKRMEGVSDDGTASSDLLFASTPVRQSFHESGGNGHFPVPVSMSYGRQMVPVHGHGRTGMSAGAGAYHGFDSHPFNMMVQRDWSGSYMSYQHVAPNDQ